MMNIYERRQRGAWGAVTPWIFIHDTDKVEIGLMVLFFGLVFSVALPWIFFCLRPCKHYIKK